MMQGMFRRLLVAAVGLMMGFAVFAPPSQASEFFGLTSSGDYLAVEEGWETMGASGAGTYRAGVRWSDIVTGVNGCTTSSPMTKADLTANLDSTFIMASKRNMRVLPYLYGNLYGPLCPTKRDIFPMPGDPEWADWDASVRAVVRRYGIGGEFWTEHEPGTANPVPYLPALTWEVWNEPNASVNNNYGPGGSASPQHYARFLIETSAVIRDEQETMLIALGAQPLMAMVNVLFGGVTSAAGGSLFNMVDFVDQAYDAPSGYSAGDLHDAYDGMSIHPYSFWRRPDGAGPGWNPMDYIDAGCKGSGSPALTGSPAVMRTECRVLLMGDKIAEWASTLSKGGKSIWVTELGYAVGAPPVGGAWFPRAEQTQNLKDSFSWLQANRVGENIKLVTWFAMRNDRKYPLVGFPSWPSFSGLIDFAGVPTETWDAFVGFTGATDRRSRPAALETSPAVARSGDGRRKMVVYRNTSGSLTVLERGDHDPSPASIEDDSGWVPHTLSAMPGTQVAGSTIPALSLNPTTGYALIVFADNTSRLQYLERTSYRSGWTGGQVGSSPPANVGLHSSPSLSRDPATGVMVIAYRSTTGKLFLWIGGSPSGAVNVPMAPDVAPTTDPKIVRDHGTGEMMLVYQGPSNSLRYLRFNGSTWLPEVTIAGATVLDTTSPGIARLPAGNSVIAYVDSATKVRTARGAPPGTFTIDPPVSGAPDGAYFANLNPIINSTSSNIFVPYRSSTGGLVGYIQRVGTSWSWKQSTAVAGVGGNPVMAANDPNVNPEFTVIATNTAAPYNTPITMAEFPTTTYFPWEYLAWSAP